MAREITPERARLGFFIHLTVFILVNVLLAVIDLRTNPQKTWFYWPLAGWGIGIVIHGLLVYYRTKRVPQ